MIIDTDIDMNMIQLQVVFKVKLIIKNSRAAWNITLPFPEKNPECPH